MDYRDLTGFSLTAASVSTERVLAPSPHEGVGNALRAAFLPRASGVPREFARLLEKLG